MIYTIAKIEKGNRSIFTYNRMTELAQIAISLEKEDFFQSIKNCAYPRLKYPEYALRKKLQDPTKHKRSFIEGEWGFRLRR